MTAMEWDIPGAQKCRPSAVKYNSDSVASRVLYFLRGGNGVPNG